MIKITMAQRAIMVKALLTAYAESIRLKKVELENKCTERAAQHEMDAMVARDLARALEEEHN